jgi:cytoskeletal protein CcmA (bactofilin family)
VLLVDQLEVGSKARVKTNISATSVVVEGIVIGNIAASKRILLLATARVLGDLKTPELIIQDGVILEGRCTISHVRLDDTQGYIQSLYDRKQSS